MFRMGFLAAVLLGATSVSAVNAADLIVEAPATPGVVDVSGNWDGAYIGVFGGYAASDWTDSWGGGTLEFEPAGWLLGVNIGADFALGGGLIAGVVADAAWSSQEDSISIVPPHTVNIDWQASLRGRLGVDAGTFLPYLTTGLAVAHGSAEYEVESSNMHIGWTAGAGVEVAVSDDVSLDLQYRYSDYGSQTYDISTVSFPYDVNFSTHQITVGLNWRF
jgi:outer membrane immunogenic protein